MLTTSGHMYLLVCVFVDLGLVLTKSLGTSEATENCYLITDEPSLITTLPRAIPSALQGKNSTLHSHLSWAQLSHEVNVVRQLLYYPKSPDT